MIGADWLGTVHLVWQWHSRALRRICRHCLAGPRLAERTPSASGMAHLCVAFLATQVSCRCTSCSASSPWVSTCHCDLCWWLQASCGRCGDERLRPFRTKLEMAVEQLDWAESWVGDRFEQRWVVVDGGYARRPFLRGARRHGFTVISRLRKDAALWSLPLPKPTGQRGPQATYGKKRISLAKRAGQKRGWQEVECGAVWRGGHQDDQDVHRDVASGGRADPGGAG